MNRKQLIENIRRKGSFLCVGLDPDLSRMPQHIAEGKDPIFTFNRAIIDATAAYAVAYKPNLAFYECHGLEGWKAFEETVRYIRRNHPDIMIIADAKRGDIGNTSRKYAQAFFENVDVDALTVAPYMGQDSVTPFVDYKDKWVVLLALTSNEGSNDFQTITDINGSMLYESVINRGVEWGTADQMMFVVGATKGKMIENVRRLAPNHFLLVPGVGAQQGSLEEVVRYGMTDECGLLVNASRSILYASSNNDFAEAAAREASRMASEMSGYLIKQS